MTSVEYYLEHFSLLVIFTARYFEMLQLKFCFIPDQRENEEKQVLNNLQFPYSVSEIAWHNEIYFVC